MSAQIVGTAPENVACSVADHRRERLGLQEPTGHEQADAPLKNAAYGRPHAFAWNIGTIASDAVAVGERHRAGRRHRERVQERRAVRVDDALRVAGRAARVTHRRGGAFVDLGPVEAGRLRGEQVVVAQHVRSPSAAASPSPTTMKCSTVSSSPTTFASTGTRRSSTMITRSSRVVDHVRELLGEQPDVERVQHRAHRRDREVRLEVLLRVPAGTCRPGRRVAMPSRASARGEPVGVVDDLGVGRAPRAVSRSR